MRENGGILVEVKPHSAELFARFHLADSPGPELRRLVREFRSGTSTGETKIDRPRCRAQSNRGFPFIQRCHDLRRPGRSGTRPSPVLPFLKHSFSVYFLKRAQILVAETWAAFFPAPSTSRQVPHPIFPGGGIHQLTMFADYRVPQILHHLKILTYPPSLLALLESGHCFEPGSKEEVSIRAASIVAVERVRDEILSLRNQNKEAAGAGTVGWDCGLDVPICSVLIDFYLWDAAKRIEDAGETVVAAHRTRSIWY